MLPFNPFSALTSKIFGGVAIAALTFGAVQTMRIEGFLFIHGFKQDVAERDKQIAALIVASDANRLAAERQIAERQSKLDRTTKDAENDHKAITHDTRTSLATYRDRMRIKNDCVSAAAGPSEREDPGVPADLPADTGMVAIRNDELQALVEWFTIGLAAHNREVAKIEAGVAEPDGAMPDPAFGR